MKINTGETLESWASRVEMFEKGRAMQRIAKGDNPIEVVEEMSRRIIDKMTHPILHAIHKSIPTYYDTEDNIKKYNEIMKNVGKAPDHIDSDT
jgi:glutamyl-tRNA reductase